MKLFHTSLKWQNIYEISKSWPLSFDYLFSFLKRVSVRVDVVTMSLVVDASVYNLYLVCGASKCIAHQKIVMNRGTYSRKPGIESKTKCNSTFGWRDGIVGHADAPKQRGTIEPLYQAHLLSPQPMIHPDISEAVQSDIQFLWQVWSFDQPMRIGYYDLHFSATSIFYK